MGASSLLYAVLVGEALAVLEVGLGIEVIDEIVVKGNGELGGVETLALPQFVCRLLHQLNPGAPLILRHFVNV